MLYDTRLVVSEVRVVQLIDERGAVVGDEGDHRVIDGAVGATWLKKFKGFMEDPVTMLL